MTTDLPARLETILTERFTELGNPFSAMRRQEKGPDGWPASHPVGPSHVADVLRDLLAADPAPVSPAPAALTLPVSEGPEYTPCVCGHIVPDHDINGRWCAGDDCACVLYRPAAAPAGPQPEAQLAPLEAAARDGREQQHAAIRAEDWRKAAEICDEAGAVYASKELNDQAYAAYQLMERFLRLADEAEYVAAPCSAGGCEPGGEPCTTHERLMAHAEGDHELCAPDCAPASGPGGVAGETQQPTDADVVEAHELALSFALNDAETQQPLVSTVDKAAALGLTDTEYRARSHEAAVATVRAAIPGMYAHVGFRVEDVLNEAGETQQPETRCSHGCDTSRCPCLACEAEQPAAVSQPETEA